MSLERENDDYDRKREKENDGHFREREKNRNNDVTMIQTKDLTEGEGRSR